MDCTKNRILYSRKEKKRSAIPHTRSSVGNTDLVMSERSQAPGVGLQHDSTLGKFRSRQNESMVLEARLGPVSGERMWMGQGCEGLLGSWQCTVSDLGGVYMGYMFTNIHQAGHLRFVSWTPNM